MVHAYLEIANNGKTSRVPIEGVRLSIGRHASNALVLEDTLASRNHCVIEKLNNQFRVRDLNSSNGTMVNGEVIRESFLEPGDIISIGSTTLEFLLGDDAPPATAAGSAVVSKAQIGAAPSKAADGDDDGPAIGFAESDDLPGAGDEPESLTADDVVSDELEERSEAAPFLAVAGPDFEQGLEDIVHALPDSGFDETSMELLSARGQMLHGQGRSGSAARREAPDLLRLILLLCIRSRSTDIHLEPRSDSFQLRLRIDGNLVEVSRMPVAAGTRLLTLTKVMCEIDLGQRTTIQEGNFVSRVPAGPLGPARRIDYRASFAPALIGQKMVLRILDAFNTPHRLSDLAMPKWMADELAQAIRADSAMILVSGPTGSGKTTSLYALIRSIAIAQRNVVTIEDPVEIQIEGVTQLPVDESQNKGFATILRSVLRQDPDVILVGEVRDPETARTAMQAAITGHLVFSTVHTKDSVGSVYRLLDLGVEPYLVAQGLQVVLAQRLVRQLCRHCKRPVPITDVQRQAMGPLAEKVTQVYLPDGCPRCLGTGYFGRRAIFEMFKNTRETRDAIGRSVTPGELIEIAKRGSFIPLAQMGYQLVIAGVAAFDDVERTVRAG
jgi:general secretion pathway protein E